MKFVSWFFILSSVLSHPLVLTSAPAPASAPASASHSTPSLFDEAFVNLPPIPAHFWQKSPIEQRKLIEKCAERETTQFFLRKIHTRFRKGLEQGAFQQALEQLQQESHLCQASLQEGTLLHDIESHYAEKFSLFNAALEEAQGSFPSLQSLSPLSLEEASLIAQLLPIKYLQESNHYVEEKIHHCFIESALKKEIFVMAQKRALIDPETASFFTLLIERESMLKASRYGQSKDPLPTTLRKFKEQVLPKLLAALAGDAALHHFMQENSAAPTSSFVKLEVYLQKLQEVEEKRPHLAHFP
ncbi:MAG: hypothetical protein K0S07_720 [Chlamydiales bacterium]|nr:hypothetical protein [Chlamydiales bacterium]